MVKLLIINQFISGFSTNELLSYAGLCPRILAPLDYFNWIPVGLINDLIDDTPNENTVADHVSGFTYPEIQSAYYTEPLNVVDFKNALKAIKPSQATAIDQLFSSYGY